MAEEKKRPKVNNEAQKELDKIQDQFDTYDENIKQMSMDRMNANAKVEDVEPQTKISQKDLDKTKDIYIKPKRSISSKEKFNEDYREDYNFAKEYVNFIAENREIIGETISLWTKPFAGMPAEEWEIPVNKPVWAPRYVAERVKGCKYHRFVMQQHVVTEANSVGQMYGAMAVDTIVQRMDAHPVNKKRSLFMGATNF
jgi:hypothetical protein